MNVKMRLYPGEDHDLIEFFASIPRRLRAGMVKQGLRSGVQTGCHKAPIQEDQLCELLEALVD